ncbi:FkbM family methyltransferase [bacterium]|nr:FkbM family methyltransferase [bacterium]
MSPFLRFIKRILKFCLPDSVLQAAKKNYYCKLLKGYSVEDEPDLNVLRYLVHPGDNVIDIGANIGLYTKALSELVGSTGQVYSVEPVPDTFEILQSNVTRLALGNVHLVMSAISSFVGTVTMEIPEYNEGGENYYEAKVIEKAASTASNLVEVETTTMDHLFSDPDTRFSFVKCDVEGHEPSVLEGAVEFLKRGETSWMIEINDDPTDPSSVGAKVFRSFLENGYSAWCYDNEKLQQYNETPCGVNFFFFRENTVKELRQIYPDLIG